MRKFIIVLVLLLIPLISYGQDNESSFKEPQKMSWIDKDGVKIGYKLDHFYPTRIDSVKANKSDAEESEKEETDVLACLVASAIIAFIICLGWFVAITAILILCGCITLLIVKFVHKH